MTVTRMLPAHVCDELTAANPHCADCGAAGADWASLSHGCLVCVRCAGQHRSLGVGISFVKSLTMDDWSDEQINRLRLGGNTRLAEFCERSCMLSVKQSSMQQPASGGQAESESEAQAEALLSSLSIAQKYDSNMAAAYRARLAWYCANEGVPASGLSTPVSAGEARGLVPPTPKFASASAFADEGGVNRTSATSTSGAAGGGGGGGGGSVNSASSGRWASRFVNVCWWQTGGSGSGNQVEGAQPEECEKLVGEAEEDDEVEGLTGAGCGCALGSVSAADADADCGHLQQQSVPVQRQPSYADRTSRSSLRLSLPPSSRSSSRAVSPRTNGNSSGRLSSGRLSSGDNRSSRLSNEELSQHIYADMLRDPGWQKYTSTATTTAADVRAARSQRSRSSSSSSSSDGGAADANAADDDDHDDDGAGGCLRSSLDASQLAVLRELRKLLDREQQQQHQEDAEEKDPSAAEGSNAPMASSRAADTSRVSLPPLLGAIEM